MEKVRLKSTKFKHGKTNIFIQQIYYFLDINQKIVPHSKWYLFAAKVDKTGKINYQRMVHSIIYNFRY